MIDGSAFDGGWAFKDCQDCQDNPPPGLSKLMDDSRCSSINTTALNGSVGKDVKRLTDKQGLTDECPSCQDHVMRRSRRPGNKKRSTPRLAEEILNWKGTS